MFPPPSILVVDDHSLMRRGLVDILTRHGCEVVGEAETAEQAIDLYGQRRPDVVILDLTLPDIPGLDLLPQFFEINRAARVVVFSFRQQPAVIASAYEAGALAYVTKGDDPQALLDAIDTACRGEKYYPPSMVASLPPDWDETGARPLDQLSKTDLKVFLDLANGKSVEEIAASMRVSTKTIINRASAICRALNCSRQDFYRLAVETGWITPTL